MNLYKSTKLDYKASALKAEAFEDWEKTLSEDEQAMISAWRTGLNIAFRGFGQMAQSELLGEIFLRVYYELRREQNEQNNTKRISNT